MSNSISNTYKALVFYVASHLLLVPALFSNDSKKEEVHYTNQVLKQDVKKISKSNLSKKEKNLEKEVEEEIKPSNDLADRLKRFVSYPELKGFKFSGKLEKEKGNYDELGMEKKFSDNVTIKGSAKSSKKKGDSYKIEADVHGIDSSFEINQATGDYRGGLEKRFGKENNVKFLYDSKTGEPQLYGTVKLIEYLGTDLIIYDVFGLDKVLLKTKIGGKKINALVSTNDVTKLKDVVVQANVKVNDLGAFFEVCHIVGQKLGQDKKLIGVTYSIGNMKIKANAGFYNGKTDYNILTNVAKNVSASIGKDFSGKFNIQASANFRF